MSENNVSSLGRRKKERRLGRKCPNLSDHKYKKERKEVSKVSWKNMVHYKRYRGFVASEASSSLMVEMVFK